MLAAACCLFGLRPLAAQTGIRADLDETAIESQQAILKSLDEPVIVEFDKTPLRAVVETLGDIGRFSIQMDVKALIDSGTDSDAPVTLRAKGLSIRTTLGLILPPLDLDWLVKKDVLLITSKERADGEQVTVIYPLRDLVTYRRYDGTAQADFDSLINVITTAISPTTWDEVGGPGSIAEFRQSFSLVVNQTREAHEQIEQCLAALRRAGDLQDMQRFWNARPQKPARHRLTWKSRRRNNHSLSANRSRTGRYRTCTRPGIENSRNAGRLVGHQPWSAARTSLSTCPLVPMPSPL